LARRNCLAFHPVSLVGGPSDSSALYPRDSKCPLVVRSRKDLERPFIAILIEEWPFTMRSWMVAARYLLPDVQVMEENVITV